MSVLYLDASAIVKIVIRERESLALRAELENWTELASSIVSRVEVARALRRMMGAAAWSEPDADAVLDGIAYLDIDVTLTREAARLDPLELRSLDAIHLASAISLAGDLGAISTYDVRLAEAARQRGIAVLSPS